MNYCIDLKKYRKERGLTQTQLAELLGVHQTMISDYEKGVQVPSVERLVQLAQVLDMSLDQLVQFERAHDRYSSKLAKRMANKESDKE